MLTNVNISAVLKQLRKTSGYVAKDVREKLTHYGIEISEKTLYGYESGLSMPNADVFVALCDIYNCDNPLDIFSQSGITAEEMGRINQYRALDHYGQDTVTAVLDCEYTRCKDQNAGKAGKDTPVPLQVAARGGKVVPPDHAPDEEAIAAAEATTQWTESL